MPQQWSAALTEFPHGLQVASYAFTFPDEDKNDTQIRIMLPLFDLLNHGNPGAARALNQHCICIMQARHCTSASLHNLPLLIASYSPIFK